MNNSSHLRQQQGRSFKPGWVFCWRGRIYRIKSVKGLLIECDDETHFRVETLYLPDSDGKSDPPVFAPNLVALQEEIERLKPPPELINGIALPTTFLEKADKIIAIVEYIEKLMGTQECQAHIDGSSFCRTEELRSALKKLREPIHLSTYYEYLRKYKRFSDRSALAASLRRSSYNQTKWSAAVLHFVDTIIMRFYAREGGLPQARIYDIAKAAHTRTGSRWIDPARCEKDVPENVITELLNTKVEIRDIIANPEKAKLLTVIDMPGKTWFMQYIKWFESQPEQGKKLVILRYGQEAWEHEYKIFDTFAHTASLPLQYVFADHLLLKVFVVDEETRSKISRLWLTVLIDCFTRSILGFALLYENPSIESIQSALRHSIFPKMSHKELGIEDEWICYGIPRTLSLDNAWAHHSHSLDSLRRLLSQTNRYPEMDLDWRPPYKGRYGSLIERFFGSLNRRMRNELPGAIKSSAPKNIREAARSASLLYEDLNRYLHNLFVQYQHTQHSELHGMTPHEKWLEAMQHSGLEIPLPWNDKIERFFWREFPATRIITQKGICAFGMHYSSPDLSQAERVRRRRDKAVGRQRPESTKYSIRYEPSNMNRLALFREGTWICDVFAKELRLPDGSYQSISFCEIQIAKDLARKEDGITHNWLKYFNDLDEIVEIREREKSTAQRAVKVKPKPKTEFIEARSAIAPADKNQAYSNSLANFSRHEMGT